MNTSSIPASIPDRHEGGQDPQKSEAHFLRMFEHATFGMCMIGLDMRFVEVNRAVCTMLGYSAEELCGTSWTALTHPDDLEVSLQWKEHLNQEPDGCQQVKQRFIHRDGAVVWVLARILLLRDKNGGPRCFVVDMENITENRPANVSPREDEDRFKAIADSCPSMMWETDAEGNIRFFNKACRQFCGIDQERLDSSEWQPLIHPSDAPEFAAALNCAIKEHTSFSAEARVRRADGAWRLLGSRAKPRFSSNGEYLGHIGLSADISERTQADRARQFELLLNRAIHDETLEGILVVNEEGEIVSRNKRFLEIWGLAESGVSGQPLDHSIGASDRTLLQAVVERVEAPEAFMNRIRELYQRPDEKDRCEVKLKDGRTLERHSTGLRNHEGKYLGRVWFFRDITAHRQAEASLQNAKDSADKANSLLQHEQSIIENERKMLHALIDNIPDYMYVKDIQSRFVVANPHLAHVVGVKAPEELLGKTDYDFYPRYLADAFYEDEQNVIRSGQPLFNREEKGIDGQGNEVDILTTKVPIRDSEGRVIGIAGVGRDISSRKKMENALRDAEQKFHGIFDNAVFGIFQSTPDGRFLSVNSSMASTYGYDSPEEMAASITDISRQLYVDPKRREEFVFLLRSCGGVHNFDIENFRKDGRRIWVSLTVRTIYQNGIAVCFEGMCEDITERRLLREQLLQAQKLESVGQLAAGIAHEINTPTQYIGDNVRFLKDSFLDLKSLLMNYERLFLSVKENAISSELIQEVATAVERADVGYLIEEIPKAIDQTLEGVTRVSALVSAMKEFSHPGTKEKVSLDLNHAIESTVTVARNEWKYVADLETDFDQSLLPILCLPGEFNQVILNLIVNAAHAIADVIREGGPEKGKITVQTRSLPQWAEIQIQDTGSGIPEEIQGRIFDPFFTTKGIGKGTGQGLAIARSVIVDKHSGTIHFETEKGKGTVFIIRLPRDGKTIAPMVDAA
ncbi:MAG: PAS domain S-box protein [Terracidiphilus sp.]|jgi:PAS domain S-box-containing protein